MKQTTPVNLQLGFFAEKHGRDYTEKNVTFSWNSHNRFSWNSHNSFSWPAGSSCTVSEVGLVQAVDQCHWILGTRLFSVCSLLAWMSGMKMRTSQQQPQPRTSVTCSHRPGESLVWNVFCTELFGTEQHTKSGNGTCLSLDLHVFSA